MVCNRPVALRPLLLCLLMLLVPVGTAGAAPREFFGVMADGPLLTDPRADLDREAGLMRTSGVGSVRLAVYWREMQPAADGPIDFAPVDRVVAATARRGLRVLPVLVRAPAWATGGDTREGAVPDSAAYARFCAAVVRRYGPTGSFWTENRAVPRTPVRDWQVWNEPDIERYWVGAPWPQTYVALLRAARVAIKGADPRARVVAAGLTNRSWEDLAALYRAGGRGQFDVAAIHPFSRRVGNVLKIVGLARTAMRRAGDASTPLALTEVSWSSGKGRSTFNYGWEFDERGQAARVREALPALAAARKRLRLHGVWWYTWLSPAVGDDESFSYAGLRRISASGVVSKPSLAAFRRAVRAAR
jgi:hypothetical protein